VSDEENRRAVIRQALQDQLPLEPGELGVLRRWVVVAEWSDADGREWITRSAGDINDEGPSIWSIKGLLYHSLETLQRDAESFPDEDEE
jgi:hypothetical protein